MSFSLKKNNYIYIKTKVRETFLSVNAKIAIFAVKGIHLLHIQQNRLNDLTGLSLYFMLCGVNWVRLLFIKKNKI